MTGMQAGSMDAPEVNIVLTRTTTTTGGTRCRRVVLDADNDRVSVYYCYWSVKAGSDGYQWVPVIQFRAAGLPPEFGRIAA